MSNDTCLKKVDIAIVTDYMKSEIRELVQHRNYDKSTDKQIISNNLKIIILTEILYNMGLKHPLETHNKVKKVYMMK